MEGIVAGILSGLISPIVLLLIQHKIIWRNQHRLEVKYQIFHDSVRALSLWCADALNPELQSNKPSFNGVQPITHARQETWELIERTRGLVQAFFLPATFEAYEAALKAKLSLDNIPNEDFEKKRVAAILALASELGIQSESSGT